MSIRAVSWAYEMIEKSAISPTAAAILVALAYFHNQDTGRCDPSIAKISARTKFSERAVRGALRDLEAARLIGTVHRKQTTGRGKRNLTSRYILSSGAGDAGCSGAPAAGGMGQEMPGKRKTSHNPSSFRDLAIIIENETEALA